MTKQVIFTSHGYKYISDETGIHQLDPQPFTYDQNYIATYDTPEYKQGEQILCALRFGFMVAAHGYIPNSLQDNGYGNGAFMRFARQQVTKVIGRDLTGYQVEHCEIVTENQPAEVYTFWDCLEHIADPSFIKDLPCDTVCVSLPWCHHGPDAADGGQWFAEKYKHRKPNEHLHHFNLHTLKNLFDKYGWKCIARSNHEDIVRKSAHGLPNILSMAFKRK